MTMFDLGGCFPSVLSGSSVSTEFSKGETVGFVVGYDTYPRIIARHIGRHLPGSPATSVENNMEGFGGCKDRALFQESNKSKLVITYIPGVRAAKRVDEILAMPAAAKKRLAFLVRATKKYPQREKPLSKSRSYDV